MTRTVAVLVAGCGLPAVAFAHHGTGTTQVSAPSLPPPLVEDASEGVAAQVGLRYDLARIDRRIQDDQIDPADEPVSLHRATLTGGLAWPGQRSVALSMPLGAVQRVDGTQAGPGDLSLWVGQGLGQTVRFRVEGGLTAPTGRYDRDAALSGVDMQGLDDGQFLIATYDTRTSLGAGSWSAQARSVLQVPVGPVGLRGYGTVSQPLNRTPDGYRWGRDGTVGATVTSPALGPLTAELGADRRWHQTDRFAFVDTDTGEPIERPVGRRVGTGLSAAVGLQVSARARCRIDGYRLVGQEADGIQLIGSGGLGAGCQLSLPMPTRRAETQVADVDEVEAEAPEIDEPQDPSIPAGLQGPP